MATALSNMPVDAFEGFSLHIDDLYDEAVNFLDGEPIATPAQAEAVSILLNRLRKASNDADEARKVEKKPHDDAAKAVQVRWKPLLDKADLAASTCKQALSPYLRAQEEAQRRAVEAAEQEARDKAEAARQAAEQARPDDLAGQATARILQESAAAATKQAGKLGKQRAQAKGGERAVSLRSTWRAEVTDHTALGRWLWEHRNADYREWLENWAQAECRHGPRSIPGVIVHEERTAV